MLRVWVSQDVVSVARLTWPNTLNSCRLRVRPSGAIADGGATSSADELRPSFESQERVRLWSCKCPRSYRIIRRCSLSRSGILGLFLELVGGLFVLLADLVEFPHVLEEVWASLERDEKLRLLAIAPVVRGLNCDGLGSDLLECGVVVPIQATQGG